MKIHRNHIIAIVVVAFCLPFAFAQPNNPTPKSNEMTLWRARRILDCGFADNCPKMQISDESIDFDTINGRNKPPERNSIALKSLDTLSAKCGYHGFGNGKFFDCEVINSLGKRVDRHDPVNVLRGFFSGMANASDQNGVEQVRFKSEVFVSALNRLHEHAIHPEAPLRNFPRVAAEWRALATKPAMPEEARVHLLVAEDEVKQQHPSLALFHYESALEIFPTWPEGWFNAALIAAEVGLFSTAAEHMQSYLALAPDAPDAQKARDQMAVWKYKAKNK